MIAKTAVIGMNVKFGKKVDIRDFVIIKDDVTIGDNVEIKEYTRIDRGVTIGDNVQIRGHSVICENMTIEGNNDLGHSLICTNHVRMARFAGEDAVRAPRICFGATVGACCTIMPGVTIGRFAKIGEGCIIRKDIPEKTVWIAPNTIKLLRNVRDDELG